MDHAPGDDGEKGGGQAVGRSGGRWMREHRQICLLSHVEGPDLVVEPEGSRALHEGLRAGHPVTVQPQSSADGLSAPFAGENCIAVCQARGVESVLVSEDEIGAGFRFLYGRAKLACEPAGAVGVAALLAGKVPLSGATAVAAVVSGGNVAAETAAAILAGR